jgi:hypothetical protein
MCEPATNPQPCGYFASVFISPQLSKVVGSLAGRPVYLGAFALVQGKCPNSACLHCPKINRNGSPRRLVADST